LQLLRDLGHLHRHAALAAGQQHGTTAGSKTKVSSMHLPADCTHVWQQHATLKHTNASSGLLLQAVCRQHVLQHAVPNNARAPAAAG
jgi:hypothetical protein